MNEVYGIIVMGIKTESLVAIWIISICLYVQGHNYKEETFTILTQVLKDMRDQSSCPTWTHQAFSLITDFLRFYPCEDPEVWELINSVALHQLAHYPKWHNNILFSGKYKRKLSSAAGIAPYFLARDTANLPITTGPIWSHIQQKVDNQDTTFMVDYISEAHYVAVNCHNPHLAWDMIQPLLKCNKEIVRENIMNLLSQVYQFTTGSVQKSLSEGFKLELMRVSSKTKIDMNSLGWLAFRVESWLSTYLPEDPSLRHLAYKAMLQVTNCNTLREWLSWISQQLLRELDKRSGSLSSRAT